MLKHLLLLSLILPALANGQPAPQNKIGRVHLVSKIVGKDFAVSRSVKLIGAEGAPLPSVAESG